jgi:hypothetical protein
MLQQVLAILRTEAVGISNVPAEIWNRHLSNTAKANLLGERIDDWLIDWLIPSIFHDDFSFAPVTYCRMMGWFMAGDLNRCE